MSCRPVGRRLFWTACTWVVGRCRAMLTRRPSALPARLWRRGCARRGVRPTHRRGHSCGARGAALTDKRHGWRARCHKKVRCSPVAPATCATTRSLWQRRKRVLRARKSRPPSSCVRRRPGRVLGPVWRARAHAMSCDEETLRGADGWTQHAMACGVAIPPRGGVHASLCSTPESVLHAFIDGAPRRPAHAAAGCRAGGRRPAFQIALEGFRDDPGRRAARRETCAGRARAALRRSTAAPRTQMSSLRRVRAARLRERRIGTVPTERL